MLLDAAYPLPLSHSLILTLSETLIDNVEDDPSPLLHSLITTLSDDVAINPLSLCHLLILTLSDNVDVASMPL